LMRFYPRQAQQCIEAAYQTGQKVHGPLLLSAEAPYGLLFRLEDKTYATLDPYKYPWGNDDDFDIFTQLELRYFPIRSHTPCGWTIKQHNGNGWRFISKHSTKQYALPTIEDAIKSYRARKERQAAIYQARADKARLALR
ncbi:hypothetical protein, partial [Parvimonas sp. D9]|uniref:hypothetical protein n=1 Tax=Parvimonas sp. D9 TaxID=3110689 RepID=UPI002B46AB60